MTRQDLRIAGILAAIVVVVGLALGYAVGMLTRGDRVAEASPDGPASFAADAAPTLTSPGGRMVPGYSDVYVNDYAQLLDPDAEARIRAVLDELYLRTGIEMTLLTISGMAEYDHFGPIEPFATDIFNTWGIGNAARNDGVLILVARGDRRMRIEIGAGYSRDWDARMQRVIDDGFLPYFRQDDYQRGIERGVDETVREVAGVWPGEWDTGPVRQGWSQIYRWLQALGDWAFAVLGAPLAGFGVWARRYLRRRPRPCESCGTVMILAGEEADDAHLDGGQKLEEYLKSVDYDVWHCPSCGRIDIHAYRNWFSSYGACPKCNYRTLSTTSTVLTQATKSSTGTKRLDYDCAHCGHHDTETRTIPKITESSSGSSGRSSFGGGSSSGGGASGSW